MGANNSNLSKNISTNEYLVKLAGLDHISPNDPYWNQLLSFSSSVSKTIFEQKGVEEDVQSLLKKFVVNNLRSGNLGSLIKVFLMRSGELHASAQCQNDMFTWQSYNALFILLMTIKHLVENVSEEEIMQHFVDPESQTENKAFLDLLLNEFYRLLIKLPIEPVTQSIHHEILNILLAFLSIQVFQAAPYDFFNSIYQVFMQGSCASESSALMQQLLNNYINYPTNHFPSQHGVIHAVTSSIGSGLWSVMTLGMSRGKEEEGKELSLDSIGNQSLLLLLILCNYFHSQESHKNPYQKAFLTLTDESISIDCSTTGHSTAASNQAFESDLQKDTSKAAAAASDDSATTATSDLVSTYSLAPVNGLQHHHASNKSQPPVKLSFAALFKRLCSDVRHTHCTLLLYMLVHHNESMRAFILSRTNIDQLILPLLEFLYTSHYTKATPAHQSAVRSTRDLYMALIILLILTEDSNFSLSMHDIHLKQVTWLSEHRQIGDISLGSLTLLVLVRTIQFNMSSMRDQYLQTNCLGALANMSAHLKNIDSYVAQKLISLFSLMLKKYKKLHERLTSNNNKQEAVALKLDESSFEHPTRAEDIEQECLVLEELIRMMLEVFNSILCHSLNHNPHLVYTMLYQKELFLHLSSHTSFHDVIFNIEMVLNYFSTGLDKRGKNHSVSQVHDFIRLSGLQFKKDRLKKFSDLNFHYVEEEKPEEFFIPYAWCLVLQHTRLAFNTTKLRLSV